MPLVTGGHIDVETVADIVEIYKPILGKYAVRVRLEGGEELTLFPGDRLHIRAKVHFAPEAQSITLKDALKRIKEELE